MWVEITLYVTIIFTNNCHAPRRACELKFELVEKMKKTDYSHAPRRACELKYKHNSCIKIITGHAPRRACELKLNKKSHLRNDRSVTPHAGRVSWNPAVFSLLTRYNVTPHAGRVSWNHYDTFQNILLTVTPHAGRVSWNARTLKIEYCRHWSRPTQGVWVEIISKMGNDGKMTVTPHAGRVSWNHYKAYNKNITLSHAPRRACELK